MVLSLHTQCFTRVLSLFGWAWVEGSASVTASLWCLHCSSSQVQARTGMCADIQRVLLLLTQVVTSLGSQSLVHNFARFSLPVWEHGMSPLLFSFLFLFFWLLVNLRSLMKKDILKKRNQIAGGYWKRCSAS